MSARGSDASRALRRHDAVRAAKPGVEQARPSPSGRHRRRIVTIAGLLALLALATSALRLFSTGYFDIHAVRVRGTSHMSDDAVREAAAIGGHSIFFLDAGAATARVRALPWVREARIDTRFPHAATISVVERVPAGVWRIGAVTYLVDEDGTVIDAGSGRAAADLPVVDASRLGADLQVGAHVDPDPLRVAQRLVASPAGTVGRSVARLEYDRENGLTAVTDRGVLVRLGDGQDLEYKLAVWQATTAKVPQAELHEIDLRFGDRPFYR